MNQCLKRTPKHAPSGRFCRPPLYSTLSSHLVLPKRGFLGRHRNKNAQTYASRIAAAKGRRTKPHSYKTFRHSHCCQPLAPPTDSLCVCTAKAWATRRVPHVHWLLHSGGTSSPLLVAPAASPPAPRLSVRLRRPPPVVAAGRPPSTLPLVVAAVADPLTPARRLPVSPSVGRCGLASFAGESTPSL